MGRNNYTGILHQYADAGPSKRGNWNQLLTYLESHSVSNSKVKNPKFDSPLPPFSSPTNELKRELLDKQGIKNEDTPLRIAMRTAPSRIIAALCHLGPDAAKIQDSRKRLPIHWACRRPPIITSSGGGNSSITNPPSSTRSMSSYNSTGTPTSNSASIKNIEQIFQILVYTYPEGLLHKDDCGRTPLHWLLWYHASTRTVNIVDMFCIPFKKKADNEQVFESAFTQTSEKDLLSDTYPLPKIPYPSKASGSFDASDSSVPASALIVHDSKHGALPLHYAVMEGASPDVVKLLVKLYPASRTLVDRRGRTPLAWYFGAGEFYCTTTTNNQDGAGQDDSDDVVDSNYYNENHQIQHISGELPDPNATPRYEQHLSTKIVQYLLNSKVARTADYDTGRVPLHWACHLLGRHYYYKSSAANDSSTNNDSFDFENHDAKPALSIKAVKLLLDTNIGSLIEKDFVGRTPLHVLFDCVEQYQKIEWKRLALKQSNNYVVVRNDLDLIRGGTTTKNGALGSSSNNSASSNFHPSVQLVELLIQSPSLLGNNESNNINENLELVLESPRAGSSVVPQYKPLQQKINENNNNATHVEDEIGQLPIHVALKIASSSEIIQLLIQSNPTSLIHTTEVELQTPLHSALSSIYTTPLQSIHTIMLLLQAYVTSKHGTYVNGRIALKMEDASGNYPLHYACRNSACLEVMRLLLKQYPKSCTCTNEDGDLPLHLLMDTYLFGTCSNINDIMPKKIDKNDIDNYIKHNVHNFTYDNVVETDEEVNDGIMQYGEISRTTSLATPRVAAHTPRNIISCNSTLAGGATTTSAFITVRANLMIKNNNNQSWESPAETNFRINQFRVVQQKILLLVEPFIHDVHTLKQTSSIHNMTPLHVAIAFNAIPYDILFKLICSYPEATTQMSAPPLLLSGSISGSGASVVSTMTTSTNKKVLLKMSPLDFHDIRRRNNIIPSDKYGNNIDLSEEQWQTIQELLFCFGPTLNNHRLRNDLLERCVAIVRNEAEGRGSVHSANIEEIIEEEKDREENEDGGLDGDTPSFDIHAESFPSFDKSVLTSLAGPTNYRPQRRDGSFTPAKEKLRKAKEREKKKKQQQLLRSKKKIATAIKKNFSDVSSSKKKKKKSKKNESQDESEKQNTSIYDVDDITGLGYVANGSYDDREADDYFDDDSMMDDERSEEEEYYSDEYDSRYDDKQFDGESGSDDEDYDSFGDDHSEITDVFDFSSPSKRITQHTTDDGIEQVLTVSTTNPDEEEKKEMENKTDDGIAHNREFSLSDVALRLWIFFNLYDNPDNLQDHYGRQVEAILDEMDFLIVDKLVNLQLPEYAMQYLKTNEKYSNIDNVTGLTVRDVANVHCKAVIYKAYHFLGMYDFKPTTNAGILVNWSKNGNTIVALANEHNIITEEGREEAGVEEQDIWKTGNISKPKATFRVTKQKVCVKFMKERDSYYREVQCRTYMRVPVSKEEGLSGAVLPLKNHFSMGSLNDSSTRKIDRRYHLDGNDERFRTLYFDSEESSEPGRSINLSDYPYAIVFPVSEERDLRDYFIRRGMIDINQIRQVLLQVGRSLQAMHGKSIVHNNVTMQNIVCLPSSSDDDNSTQNVWGLTNLSYSCQKAAQSFFVGGISSGGSLQFATGAFPPEMFVQLNPSELKQYNLYWANVCTNHSISIDKEAIDSHIDEETGDSYVLRCYYNDPDDTQHTSLQDLPYKLLPARETFDLWSFGLVMFTLCSGGHPLFPCNSRTGNLLSFSQIAKWDKKTAKRIIYKHIDDPIAQDLLIHLLGSYEERASLRMEAVLAHPFFTKPVNMEKALNRMIEHRAQEGAALSRAIQSSSSKRATERWLEERTTTIDCWDFDFQLRLRLSPSELIQKFYGGSSNNPKSGVSIIPYSFIVLPYILGTSKTGKLTPVTKTDIERAEKTGIELLNLSKAIYFATKIEDAIAKKKGEKTTWSAADLSASLDLSADDFKDLETELISVASKEVEMFRDNPMYIANKLVQSAIKKLIERYEESKKAYVYLVDEYKGLPIVGDDEDGVAYPHEVSSKVSEMVTKSLPFMHMCILYLRGVGEGIGGLVKLIFEGAYPHIPPSWEAISKGLSHELNEQSMMREIRILHDALADTFSVNAKGNTRSIDDLRFVERHFLQFDKKQNFAGLLRVTNGNVSIWTRKQGVKEIEEETSSLTFIDAYKKKRSIEEEMKQQRDRIAELEEKLEKLEFRDRLGLNVPE